MRHELNPPLYLLMLRVWILLCHLFCDALNWWQDVFTALVQLLLAVIHDMRGCLCVPFKLSKRQNKQ